MTTLRQLIHQLQTIVEQNPTAGDAPVFSVHSASGAVDHLNGFYMNELKQRDLDGECGCVYEDAGLSVGDKVIQVSVGGN